MDVGWGCERDAAQDSPTEALMALKFSYAINDSSWSYNDAEIIHVSLIEHRNHCGARSED